MIQSAVLQLGMLMIPWPLVFLLLGLIVVFAMGKFFQRRYTWNAQTWTGYQDALWNALWIGALVGRAVFVLQHYELYFANPIDILKIQDKGFHLIAAVMAGVAWFVWKNRAIQRVVLAWAVALFITVQVVGWSLIQPLQTQHAYPNLVLHNLAQQPQDLAQFSGQPTVINLWATWCPVCHREMPVMQQAQQDFPEVNFVFANQGEFAAEIQAYLQKHRFQFEHLLLDPAARLGQHFNMFGLPSTLFFNAQGELVDHHMGELTKPMLQHYLKKIQANP